ncbi:hypothetical protein B0H13DRAFT_2311666 [Mycena leptocephala]|nr:hypothetical protein B0H13DRAFT_2311666 [Mycena leptocephala]
MSHPSATNSKDQCLAQDPDVERPRDLFDADSDSDPSTRRHVHFADDAESFALSPPLSLEPPLPQHAQSTSTSSYNSNSYPRVRSTPNSTCHSDWDWDWTCGSVVETPSGPRYALKLRSALIGLIHLPGHHDGEHLGHAFLHVIDCIRAAKNNATPFEPSGKVATTFMDAIDHDPIATLRAIVRQIRSSSLRRQFFSDVLKSLQLKDLELLRDVITRWSSTLLMIDRGLFLRLAVDSFLSSNQFEELRKFKLGDEEWGALEVFKKILDFRPEKVEWAKELFKNAVKEYDTNPIASPVHPTYESWADEILGLDDPVPYGNGGDSIDDEIRLLRRSPLWSFDAELLGAYITDRTETPGTHRSHTSRTSTATRKGEEWIHIASHRIASRAFHECKDEEWNLPSTAPLLLSSPLPSLHLGIAHGCRTPNGDESTRTPIKP